MTVKELNKLHNKIKDITDYIFTLFENESNTTEDKIKLLLLNAEITSINTSIVKLMKDILE